MQFNNISIDLHDSDTRIDRFLRKKFPYLNQASIEKALRAKLIKVNQNKIQANHRVIENDQVQIASMLINEDYIHVQKKSRFSAQDLKKITDNIIYRDADILIINKPSGLAVQGGSKIKISVDDLMPQVLESFGLWDEGLESKLVHRIDKETSGILIIALNNRVAKELASAFKNHQVEKKYLAILKGEVRDKSGRISSIINKDEKRNIKSDNAVTLYKVISRKNKHSFVEYMPVTGKNHQLRLHSLELGFPILGDSKYDMNYSSNINLHLHASEIRFPYNGQVFKIKADLPDYYLKTVKNIFGNVKW